MANSSTQPKIVVIGSGVAGILTGIRLLQRCLTDFTILGKADSLGGTWRDNVYPGVARDVPAHLYSFSFEPNRVATHRFATGPELWDYLHGVAEKYGVPNAEVVTTAIHRVEHDGVRTSDGALHPLDVLVLATGFHADLFLRPMQVTGEDGVDLDQLWRDVPLNYKSVALPHMPNFFMINGPFSPGGSASVLSIIETHVDFVMQLVDTIVEQRVSLAPDEGRSSELLAEIRQRASKTVWATGGCSSWYLDQDGVPLVDPLLLDELAEDMRTPDLDDFVVPPLQGSPA